MAHGAAAKPRVRYAGRAAGRPVCPCSLTRPAPGGHLHDHEGICTAIRTKSFVIMETILSRPARLHGPL